MRTIIIGIITAASIALTLAACSSSGNPATIAPTATSVNSPGIVAPAKNDDGCGGGNCLFGATPYPGAATIWKGPTSPAPTSEADATGHPGLLTVNFPATFAFGTTLTWDKFAPGVKGQCWIDLNGTKIYEPTDCKQGSYVVYPSANETIYTFTNTKNGDPSKDNWQMKTATAYLPTTVENITITWAPNAGFTWDDVNGPSFTYTGKVSGPLTGMTAVLQDPAHVHCGHAGGAEYTGFTAHMTLKAGKLDGDYDANVSYGGSAGCTAARGTFTLTQQGS